MLWFKNRSRAARSAILLAVVLGLATPVLAGTVYSWRTEDGTLSFTDDQKHIPARYRGSAMKRETKPLKDYDRFTGTATKTVGSYEERLQARQSELDPGSAPDAASEPQTPSTLSVMVGGTRYGRGGLIAPVGGAASEEPVVTEHKRVRAEDSMATQHVTVVKQGDRVIAISKEEKSHRGTSMIPPTDD